MLTNEILYLPPGRSLISQNIDLYTSIASDNVRYSLPNTIKNFLSRYARGISNFDQRNIGVKKHEEYFLNSLFRGDLKIDTKYGSKSLIFKKQDNSSPLQRTASMIQDLAGIPVILFGAESHFLIIEEPEAHLHPENQMIFAKWLIKYMHDYEKVGIVPKIVITTHSENIIAELENIIALCRIDFGVQKPIRFDEDLFINWKDIHLYSFEEMENQGFISNERNKISKGFEGEIFGETVEKIYEEYQKIVEYRNEFGEINE